MSRFAAYSRGVVLALLAAVFVALVPGTAAACSCAPVQTKDMVDQAHTVFVGEEDSRTEHRGASLGFAVTFRVVEAYKGLVTDPMVVKTGMGTGDCGVPPIRGLVGITISGEGEPFINICGSVHDAVEIAALLEPIDIIAAEPTTTAPSATPTADPAGIGPGGIVIALGVALVILGVAREVMRRRRENRPDSWSSEA